MPSSCHWRLAVTFRGDLRARFTPSTNSYPADRALFTVALVVLIALLPALVVGIFVRIPACAAAATLAVAFVLRRTGVMRIGVVPWSLLVCAGGMLLMIDSAHQIGLGAALAAVTGDGTGFGSLLRLAGAGVAGANLANNLPA